MSHVSKVGIGLALALMLAGCGRDQETPPGPSRRRAQWLVIFPLFPVFIWRARWSTQPNAAL